MDDLTRKTVKNSAYSFVAFAWPVLLAFFVTPFIVHALGVEKYGIYSLAITFVGFLGFLDFGVSPSLVKYTAEYYARKDYQLISRLFNTALIFYLFVGIIAAILIAGFSYFYAPHVLKITPENARLTQIVLYIAAGGFLVNLVLSAFSALPGALQRFDITSKINLLITTISTGLTVLILLAGKGLVGITLLGLCTSLGGLVMYIMVNKRLIPHLTIRPQFDRKVAGLIFKFGGYATISAVASTVLFQLDKLILGSMLGAAAVAYYVLPGSLAIKIHSTIVALTTVIFPLSSELFAQDNIERLHNLYFRATRIVITLIAIGVTPMYLLANSFLLQWVGPEFAANSTLVFQLLLATYSILALTAVPFFILYGAARPKTTTIFAVMSGVLNVVLLVILIPPFGINGAAFAYLLSVIPSLIFVRYVEKKILHLAVKKFYFNMIPKLAGLVIFSLAVTYVLQQFVSSLKTFVLIYLIVIAVSTALFAVLRLADPQDIKLAQGLWRNVRS